MSSKDKSVAKPTARIPSSREESSSNWKSLLLSQGKPLPPIGKSAGTRKQDKTKEVHSADAGDPEVPQLREEKGTRDRSRSSSQRRSKSQLSIMSVETVTSVGTDNVDSESELDAEIGESSSQKVKKEFRALGLSGSNKRERQGRLAERHQKANLMLKKLPPGGLNDFGFFDYNHYGILRTPLTPAHEEFMEDTGIVSMDCEMVGVGPMKESALGRVSIVNEYGFCLYDRFVKPRVDVTDYRTQFSGIRENDLKNATPFQVVTKEVADLLKSHILVGHSLKSDLSVLYLSHPKARTRDTATYFKRILHTKTPKLKTLAKKVLGVDIQEGEHSSIIDAQATMALYRLYQKDWEISVRQSNRGANILKQTLDEFHELKSSTSTAQYSMNETQNDHRNINKWYECSENRAELLSQSPVPMPISVRNFMQPVNVPLQISQPMFAPTHPVPRYPLPPPFIRFSPFPGLPPPPFPISCAVNSHNASSVDTTTLLCVEDVYGGIEVPNQSEMHGKKLHILRGALDLTVLFSLLRILSLPLVISFTQHHVLVKISSLRTVIIYLMKITL